MGYDTKKMFSHACAFDDIAYLCIKEPSPFEIRTRFHTISGIVNSAFACEIFLKTLLMLKGESKNRIKSIGHGLMELWNEYKIIDITTSNRIEKEIQGLYKTNNENLFLERITEASYAFEHWRYIYEKDNETLDLNFLTYFRLELREECCQQLYGVSWGEYKKRLIE